MYKKTSKDGLTYYEYTTDPNDTVYELTFTYIGTNQGNYTITDTGINGTVYTYVVPLNGVPQGEYEPVIPLVAPNRKQVLSTAVQYQLKDEGFITFNAGVSNFDKNLLSGVGNNTNTGLGMKLTAHKKVDLATLQFKPTIDYEYVAKEFSPIERLRLPEFFRSFNLYQAFDFNHDIHYLTTKTPINHKNVSATYQLDVLRLKDFYKGNKHNITANYTLKNTNIHSARAYLNSKTNKETTDFLTYNAHAKLRVKKWNITTGFLGEYNRRKFQQKDSLSFAWQESFLQARLGDSIRKHIQFKMYYRKDDSTHLGTFKGYSNAYGIHVNSKIIQKEQHNFSFRFHYRNVAYNINLPKQQFLNAGAQWQKSFLKKGINLMVDYQVFGGTEQQRSFEYKTVDDGLGIYKWIDFNQDGIQQLDEFEVAEFADQANYIRVYTNSLNSLKVNHNQTKLNVYIVPKAFSTHQFLQRWQSHFAYTINTSALKDKKIAYFNPWENPSNLRGENSLCYIKTQYNNSKGYRWHVDHIFKQQTNTNLINTGLESLKNRENRFEVSYDWNDFFSIYTHLYKNKVESNSAFFKTRNYKVIEHAIAPGIQWNLANKLQATLQYKINHHQNQTGLERLNAQDLQFNMDYNYQKNKFSAQLNWVKNRFEGNLQSVLANRLMQGLNQGNNWVWNTVWQRQINQFLHLNVQYNGRKTNNHKTIHSGTMQIRVSF